MKKAIITIIIAAIIVIAGACGVYAAETSSNTSSTNNSLSTSSQNNASTTPTITNNQNNTTESTNASTKTNTTNTSNTSNVSNSNTNGQSANLQNNQNIDWDSINSTRVLTQNQKAQFLTQLENATENNTQGTTTRNDDQGQLDQVAYQYYQSYNKIVQSEISTIKPQLSGQALVNFNNLINDFNQYNQNSVLTFYPNSQGGSMLPMSQNSTAGQYSMNMAYFLAFAYGPTSNLQDPQLGQSFGPSYLVFTEQNKTVQKYYNAFENQELSNSKSLNNINMNNATDAITAYKNILTNWTSQIDNCYNYIKFNSGGSINTTNLTQAETQWINFRNQLIQSAGNGLTGINKQLAELRMNIMMTQLQSYNLITNLSAYVGIHY